MGYDSHQIYPNEVPLAVRKDAALAFDEWIDPIARTLLDVRRVMFDRSRDKDIVIFVHCQVLL